MTLFEHFNGLFAMSACICLIISFGLSLYVMGFIVKRYEEETDLTNFLFFKEHVTFARYIPSYWSATLYLSHFGACCWFWRWFKNTKPFRDINNPNDVIKHFSKGEIQCMGFLSFAYLMTFIHFVASMAIDCLWPEVFG